MRTTPSPLVSARQDISPTYTENGAITHTTSSNRLVDMFFMLPVSSQREESEIERIFQEAYNEDPIYALKCLFWTRDARGWAGMRHVFRVCLRWLYHNMDKYEFEKLLRFVPEYGRWDDLWKCFTDKWEEIPRVIIDFVNSELFSGRDALIAKWLPRKWVIAKQFYKHILWRTVEFSHGKGWRKQLVKLTRVVEQQMSKNQWSEINYKSVPSVANKKYSKAFLRNDEKRRAEFIESVSKGDTTMNVKWLFPHDIVRGIRGTNGAERDMWEAMWKAYPKFPVSGSVLPVVDTSFSMTFNPIPKSRVTALDISIALGLYISENNDGPFKDSFITFSGKPQLHTTSWTLQAREKYVYNAMENYDTNLQWVFDILLAVAKERNISEKDMPKTLIILSDMEFNAVASRWRSVFNHSAIKERYKAAGYEMPLLVYWNLRSSHDNVPIQKNEYGLLVSGYSVSILNGLLKGITDPVAMVKSVLDSERYRRIN